MKSISDFLRGVDLLGEKVTKRLNSPHTDFPSLAAEELKNADLHPFFNSEIFPELQARHSELEKNYNVISRFPWEECYVLYFAEEFTIELYHWRHTDTSIHGHNFQGAFQCLSGKNRQIEYLFKPSSTIFEGLHQGELQRIDMRDIGPGDIQTIQTDDKFIHQVTHISSTTNLCVRTKKLSDDKGGLYHKNGLEFLPSPGHHEEARRIKADKNINLETLNSTVLTCLFHSAPERQAEISNILFKRHGIDYLKSWQETVAFLNRISQAAKLPN